MSWQEECGFTKSDKKLKIFYTNDAYHRMYNTVLGCPIEIGWNMYIEEYEDGYRISGIYVYPQKMNAGYISVDLANYGMWKANLSDDVEAHLNGQAHSHVFMDVFPSGRDQDQQQDEIVMKKNGFYLFQIWNKLGEINSFFYDIDNKIYYTSDEIELIIEARKENGSE